MGGAGFPSERSMGSNCWVAGRALAGQMLFRHKRRKLTYMLVFLGIVALHVAFWIAWCRLAR